MRRGKREDSTINRILEELRFDGGWLTADGLVAQVPDADRMVVKRSLFRLRERGLVISRPRPLNEASDAKRCPREWRAA